MSNFSVLNPISKGPVVGKYVSYLESYIFKEIPYALCPVGPQRFTLAKELNSWTKAIKCTEQKPNNEQNLLHLNVYTQSTATEDELPVMVFIPGESLFDGYKDTEFYGPEFILNNTRYPIVLVVVSYRKGVLGFLNSPEESVQANCGLYDIFLALKWVNREIKYFGGSSQNVTLIGHGSGANNIWQMLHKQFRTQEIRFEDMFDKLILQSCTLFSPISGSFDAKKYAVHLGVASKITSHAEAVQKLRMLSLSKLESGMATFLPEKDYDFNEENMQCKKLSLKSIMIGSNSSEGLYLYKKHRLASKQILKNLLIPTEKNSGSALNVETKNAIIRAFQGDRSMMPKHNFLQLLSELHSNIATMALAQICRRIFGRVYLYHFDYDGGRNLVKEHYKITCSGACHGDELGYLFKTPLSRHLKSEPDMVYSMVRWWTDFASQGLPHCCSWRPILTDDQLPCMIINNKTYLLNEHPCVENYKKIWMPVYKHLQKYIRKC